MGEIWTARVTYGGKDRVDVTAKGRSLAWFEFVVMMR